MLSEKTSIKKWGTGICIPVLKNARDILGLEVGTELQMDIGKDEIRIRKVKTASLFPFSEQDLLADCAPAGFHDDLLVESFEDEELEV